MLILGNMSTSTQQHEATGEEPSFKNKFGVVAKYFIALHLSLQELGHHANTYRGCQWYCETCENPSFSPSG